MTSPHTMNIKIIEDKVSVHEGKKEAEEEGEQRAVFAGQRNDVHSGT